MKILPLGPAPEHLTLASSSASGGSYLGSDPCAESYIRTVKIVRSIPVVTSILRPLVGASSSSTSASSSSTSSSTTDLDSYDDYPEIRANACEEPAEGGRLICMVTLNSDRSNNTSSRYPTIRRSEASDTRTPSGGLVQNLNPDFNAVRVQTIMESIQHMAPNGSPLVVLTQQGAEAKQKSRPTIPGGNLPSATTIGQGVPEVKLCH
jgi:hypothetical protein